MKLFGFALTLAMKDGRGKPSVTLLLVWLGYAVLLVKFALEGLTVPWVGQMPPMSGVDFAAAAAALLLGWGYREHTEKRYPSDKPAPFVGREPEADQ